MDPLTLRAWGTLRKIILDYGKPYWFRYQIQLVYQVIYNIQQLVLLTLSAVKLVELSVYGTILNLYDIGITSVILIIVFFKMSLINDYFLTHKSLVQENKQFLIHLLRNKETYFTDSLPVKNIVYKKVS